MKRKWKWAGLLLAAAVVCTCVYYLGRQEPETEVDRQETDVSGEEMTAAEQEKEEKQDEPETQTRDNDETDFVITEAESFAEAEDWASSEESFVIADEYDKDEVPALCGISENKIYYEYSISDDEKDKMTLIYCMYDRESKETEKLCELEVRDAVFPAIFYNEHLYILDVAVPSYQIWDVSADGSKLFMEGSCRHYPELQLSGSRLLLNVYQEEGNEITCILSWTDLLTEESGVIQMTTYEENNKSTGTVSGTELCRAGGWGDGVIYETFTYDDEPRYRYYEKGRDYGKQELWYYDFATGKATRQELTLGQHSYYVGGDEEFILIDRASTSEPLPKSGTLYERTASGYVSRKIPGIEATNSVVHTRKMANGQILVECMGGFLLLDIDNIICTGEKTFNFTYSDTEIAFVDEEGTVHIRKYADER